MKKSALVLASFVLPILLAAETVPYGIPYSPRPAGPVAPSANPAAQGIAPPENLAAATAIADSPAAVVDESPAQDAPNITDAYSRSDFDGAVIAAGKTWYLEEADSLGRPATGTLWKDGSIVKVTSWLYYGDSQRAEKKIETSSDQSAETGYDKAGNVILVEVTSSKGEVVSRLENSWTDKGLLASSVYRKGKTVTRTEYEYARSDGKDVLKSKRLFKNDELVSRCDYSDEDSWVETVFSQGKPILAVDYVKGERMGKHDEEKF